jgi:hypothetical protein
MQDHSRQDIDADDVIGLAPEGLAPFHLSQAAKAKFCIASRKNAGRIRTGVFFGGMVAQPRFDGMLRQYGIH